MAAAPPAFFLTQPPQSTSPCPAAAVPPLSSLQPLASKFFIFAAFMVLCQQAAVSLAQAVSAVCRDVDTSGARRWRQCILLGLSAAARQVLHGRLGCTRETAALVVPATCLAARPSAAVVVLPMFLEVTRLFGGEGRWDMRGMWRGAGLAAAHGELVGLPAAVA